MSARLLHMPQQKGGGCGETDLGAHEDEAKGVDSAHKGVEDKAVPAPVGLVQQGVTRVTHQDGVQHVAQIADGISVVPLCLTGTVVACHKNGRVLLDHLQSRLVRGSVHEQRGHHGLDSRLT